MFDIFRAWIGSPIVAGIITGISLLIGAYSLWRQQRAERENKNLRREAQTITWDDLRLAADDLVHQIRRDKGKEWRPDFTFSFDSRGGIICELVTRQLCPGVPQLVGIAIHKADNDKCLDMDGFFLVETLKWNLYVPTQIQNLRSCRVLLVDDYVQGGTAIRALVKLLNQKGVKPRELVSCSVVKSKSAVSLVDCIPDFFWSERDDARFFWPWGVAR